MRTRVSGPLFKFFGSKWRVGARYPVPSYGRVVEAFAGGAGYSLRHSEREVLLVERHPEVRALWKWLIEEASESEIRGLPVNVAVGTDIRTLGVSSGGALLMKYWQRTNCLSGCWTVSPWGNLPGQWTESTRSRVAEEISAVKHWKVAGSDAFAFFGAQRGLEATWLVDPPYQYGYRYGGPQMAYEELVEAISKLAGEVIACEAVCPKTKRVPDYLPFEMLGEFVTSRRKSHQSHHSAELIWHRK